MEGDLSMDDLLDDDSLDFIEAISSDVPKEDPNNDDQNNDGQTQKEIDAAEAVKAAEAEKQEIEDKKKITPSDDTVADNDNLSLFASALAEEGVITNLPEGGIKTFEELTELMRTEIRSNELAGLNDAQKDYLKALEQGITHSEYTDSQSKISSLDSIKDADLKENEDLQRQFIVDDFVSKGYSKEKADKFAQRSFDLGTNAEDALESLTAKREEAIASKAQLAIDRAKQIKTQEEDYVKIQADIKEKVFDEKKEIIPGIKFSKKVADEVYQALTKPAGYTKDNQPLTRAQQVRMKDPLDFEHKINTLLVLTKDLSDFSVFEGRSTSKKAKEFIEKIKTSSSTETNGGGFTNYDSDGDLDWIADNLK